jgi:hypothetical protein
MEDLKKVQEFFSKPLPEQSKEDPTDINRNGCSTFYSYVRVGKRRC